MNVNDVPSLLSLLGRWETVEYFACGIVFLGVGGEIVADFTTIIKDKHFKKQFAMASAIALLLGLGGELASLIKVSILTGSLITILNQQSVSASQAATTAKEAASAAEAAANQAQKDAVQARTDANAERLARQQLQAAITPRTLTEKQVKELTDVFRPLAKSHAKVIVRGTMPFGSRVAVQINAALIEAGFDSQFNFNYRVWYELGVGSTIEDSETAAALSGAIAKTANMAIMGFQEILPPGSPIILSVGEKFMGKLPTETIARRKK